jgi:predicted dehydrogenase
MKKMTMTKAGGSRRVAVAGVRGIGKHHAKWWALEGANVCAVAGTSVESADLAREELNKLFPFTGRTFASYEEMLESEQPDIVDICTPPERHADHIRRALEAGCNVLCEKPFVYDPALPHETLLDTARELIALAESKGLLLGVCTQYAVGARMFWDIWDEHGQGNPITHYHGHLESPAKGRAPNPKRVWVDLAPHPISVMLRMMPAGQPDWASLKTEFRGYEASATLMWEPKSGAPVECNIVTRNALAPPLNVRHFKVNGYPFVIEGHNDALGVYCARIETPDGAVIEPDMMRLVIRDSLAEKPTVQGREIVDNLEIMLRVLNAAE